MAKGDIEEDTLPLKLQDMSSSVRDVLRVRKAQSLAMKIVWVYVEGTAVTELVEAPSGSNNEFEMFCHSLVCFF